MQMSPRLSGFSRHAHIHEHTHIRIPSARSSDSNIRYTSAHTHTCLNVFRGGLISSSSASSSAEPAVERLSCSLLAVYAWTYRPAYRVVVCACLYVCTSRGKLLGARARTCTDVRRYFPRKGAHTVKQTGLYTHTRVCIGRNLCYNGCVSAL